MSNHSDSNLKPQNLMPVNLLGLHIGKYSFKKDIQLMKKCNTSIYYKKIILLVFGLTLTALTQHAYSEITPEGCYVYWSGSWTYGENYETSAEAVSTACANFESATCSSSDWSSCNMTSCGVINQRDLQVNLFDSSVSESRSCTHTTLFMQGNFDLIHERTGDELTAEYDHIDVSSTPYKLKPYCPHNYQYEKLPGMSGTCKAYCPENASWNSTTLTCDPTPEELSCKEETANPINLVEGVKKRHESILNFSGFFGFELVYHYNNHSNHEPLAFGIAANPKTQRFVLADETRTIRYDEYIQSYTQQGVIASAGWVHSDNSVNQYWRHNFEESLVQKNDQWVFHNAQGHRINFSGINTFSTNQPMVLLTSLTLASDDFDGYEISYLKKETVKRFNANGQLVSIKYDEHNTLNLTYSADNLLESITNSVGQSFTFNYEEKATDSLYAYSESSHDYPISITSSDGRKVDLTWEQSYTSSIATHHLLTFISYPYITDITGGREFTYDEVWPLSIDAIYDISNIEDNTKTLYANFDYDDQGRTIVSELADGSDRVSVSYPTENTRVITNALHKNSTFTFADVDGVTRLKSVAGEATVNCAESNTAYEYYPNGYIDTKTENDRITKYTYENNGLEETKIEALGTPQEKTTYTQWHSGFSKPTKIIEPERTTVYTYDDQGRLTNTQIQSND